MKLRTFVVHEGYGVTLETDPDPSRNWLDDGVIRWLSVEAATRDQLEQLFDRLGGDGKCWPITSPVNSGRTGWNGNSSAS